MTDAVVVDASIAVAWVHPDQRTVTSEALLDALNRGIPAHAPSIWPLEVSNALLALSRRGKLSEKIRQAGLHRLSALRVLIDQDGVSLAWDRLSDLAVAHSLSVYDAAYVELALRRGFKLASKDEALRRAATLAGLTLWA